LAISKACPNKELAFKFIQALVSSDLAVTDYYIPLGSIPPLKSLIAKFKDRFSDPVSRAYTTEIIPSSVPMPFGPKFTAAAEVMLVGMQRVVTTNEPVDKILKDVQVNLKGVYGS
ncbi:MAG TPA: hypothetical protein VN203_05060, partial [Candidatus Acidoferrum sp.]|nr:hypothetical protein [Candidatus Acidoferrum sp.]